MALLHSILDQYDRETDLFVLFPQDQTSKKTEAAPKEKKAPAPGEPLTALQDVPGPAADDRLLDLLQKDLDRAMQQPPGRRKIQFSIPVTQNDRVKYFVDFFCGRKRNFFAHSLARSGKYIPMMATILSEEGLPEDLVYLSLIESGFSPHAVSKAQAVGQWQFIRGTGVRYGLRIDGWIDERRDPLKSTRAAAAYLKDLHLQFGEWFLAAAAYNAGEKKVEKAVNRYDTNDFWDLSQRTYLKRETRNYVPKFIAATLIAGTPEKYGFEQIKYESPLEYEEVTVNGPLKLETAAKLARTTVGTIKELNPALLKNITPPHQDEFALRLPSGSGKIFTQAYHNLPDSAKVNVVTHTVKKGETLVSIAKRYHQRVSQVLELNNLSTRRVRPGQELIILLDGAAQSGT